MSLCIWCRSEYTGSGIFHVCSDGTTLADRILKTEKQIAIEHARQWQVQQEQIKSVKPVASRRYCIVDWNEYDYNMLKGMKIKP